MMSSERSSGNESPTPWRVEEELREGLSIRVRIVPEAEAHATEMVDATAVRKLTMAILKRLGFTQTERLEEIALVISEFAANSIQHGGELSEVAIAYDPETLRIQTANPLTETTSLLDESRRGKRARDVPNDIAENGRGLQLTQEFADMWGQLVMGRFVLTYACFYQMQRQQAETTEDTPPHAV